MSNCAKLEHPPKAFQFAKKPEELSGWDGIKKFIWNNATSEFMGRTGINWFKIIIFYIIYYSCLAGYFIAMLVIFYQTLDDKTPKWKKSDGIIGQNPGVGFRPGPDDKNIESTLIYFNHGSLDGSGNWKPWVNRLGTYLKRYKSSKLLEETKTNNEHLLDRIDCDFDRLPGVNQICKVKVDELMKGPCTLENNFGYDNGSPCILIKLNKIYNWTPTPYLNSSEIFEDKAPNDLFDYIKGKENNGSPEIGNTIYIWCEGENPADKENLGLVDYYPSAGIPTYYFPYKNQQGYISPAIFAHFKRPKHGVLISITCKAWAKNIHHNAVEREGTTHFEIMID